MRARIFYPASVSGSAILFWTYVGQELQKEYDAIRAWALAFHLCQESFFVVFFKDNEQLNKEYESGREMWKHDETCRV